MIVEHLKNMADHSIHFLHGATREETGYLLDHEVIQEGNHTMIMNFLEHFAESHPHVAKHMAKKLLRVCNRVLEQQSLIEHHQDSAKLKKMVKEFHDRIQCSYENGHSFDEYGNLIGNTSLGLEEQERIRDRMNSLEQLQRFTEKATQKTLEPMNISFSYPFGEKPTTPLYH